MPRWDEKNFLYLLPLFLSEVFDKVRFDFLCSLFLTFCVLTCLGLNGKVGATPRNSLFWLWLLNLPLLSGIPLLFGSLSQATKPTHESKNEGKDWIRCYWSTNLLFARSAASQSLHPCMQEESEDADPSLLSRCWEGWEQLRRKLRSKRESARLSKCRSNWATSAAASSFPPPSRTVRAGSPFSPVSGRSSWMNGSFRGFRSHK